MRCRIKLRLGAGLRNKKRHPAKQSAFVHCQKTYFAPRTASLHALATRNFTTFLAGILISAPVAGLRPMRALRFTSTSFPRPGKVNSLAFLLQQVQAILLEDFHCLPLGDVGFFRNCQL